MIDSITEAKVSKSVAETLDLIRREEILFVDFRFTDTLGAEHHITYDANFVSETELGKGIMFDGSSISGWKEINKSDMLLKPDFKTSFIDPLTQDKTLSITCDVFDPITGQMYERDPRGIAKRAEKFLSRSGLAEQAFFGPEMEFFIFEDVKMKADSHHISFRVDSEEGAYNNDTVYELGNHGMRSGKKGGYTSLPPVDSLHEVRAYITSILPAFGLRPTLHHHEVAESQCEIGFEYDTLTRSADNIQKFKYAVKKIVIDNGQTVTFMPKPIHDDNGSGMHVHQSLWKKDIPLFLGEGGYADLSEACLYYIGGLVKHAKSINAFANPTTNSYKRLKPGFEAPVHLAYSAFNRSASIRIPYIHNKSAKRIEARFPDPSANPYLAFAAMLMAGLDGIKNKIHPGDAKEENLYELSELKQKKIPMVAGTLREALVSLDKDREYLVQGDVFSNDMIDAYIKLKMIEVEELESMPHPLEYKLYYGC